MLCINRSEWNLDKTKISFTLITCRPAAYNRNQLSLNQELVTSPICVLALFLYTCMQHVIINWTMQYLQQCNNENTMCKYAIKISYCNSYLQANDPYGLVPMKEVNGTLTKLMLESSPESYTVDKETNCDWPDPMMVILSSTIISLLWTYTTSVTCGKRSQYKISTAFTSAITYVQAYQESQVSWGSHEYADHKTAHTWVCHLQSLHCDQNINTGKWGQSIMWLTFSSLESAEKRVACSLYSSIGHVCYSLQFIWIMPPAWKLWLQRYNNNHQKAWGTSLLPGVLAKSLENPFSKMLHHLILNWS